MHRGTYFECIISKLRMSIDFIPGNGGERLATNGDAKNRTRIDTHRCTQTHIYMHDLIRALRFTKARLKIENDKITPYHASRSCL